MTGHVVDAGVVVKWLVTEKFSDEAASLLKDGSTLAAPELVFADETLRLGPFGANVFRLTGLALPRIYPPIYSQLIPE